jgi:hypothetical protein
MAQLSKAEVIKSNKLLGNLLGVNAIHNLRRLFDTGRITEYIRQERALHHLDPTHVDVKCIIHGTNRNNTSILINIVKHGKTFIHLSIHVAPKDLKTGNKEKGVVHIYKDIYENSVDKNKDYLLYAIYYLQEVENASSLNEPNNAYENIPIQEVNNISEMDNKKEIENKPIYPMKNIPEQKNQSKPITFSIGYGYSTPIYPDAPQDYIDDVARYDDEVKQEMDAITSVLNKLFDRRNKEYYIGNRKNMYEINNHLMMVLNNVNKRQKHISRKNKGLMLNQSNPSIRMNRSQLRSTRKQKAKKEYTYETPSYESEKSCDLNTACLYRLQ